MIVCPYGITKFAIDEGTYTYPLTPIAVYIWHTLYAIPTSAAKKSQKIMTLP